jgi:SAM-dependent methyltransferase
MRRRARRAAWQDAGVQEHAADRDRLRRTFDAAAGTYQQARPEYPAELYDALAGAAGLRPGDRLLEIGCATGISTIPLARRGMRITCVEPGPALAAEARRNLAGFPDVEVVTADFEAWPPAGDYDLVFAATAWHWIDPAAGFDRAWALLRPGGHLAVWEQVHVIPYDGDPFFGELQEVYDEISEPLPDGWVTPRPGELTGLRAEMEASGRFTDVAVSQYDWEIRYDAESYIRLLGTFSGHIAMEPWQRGRLYGEIRRRLAARPDGLVRRHWGAVLSVARRRDDAPDVTAAGPAPACG